ncbi:hypothetical protein BD309DRAFT_1073009 [Dichomitus squalens]|nr:hypothetical protein BD309DRAFT_1073009 [Dichomitus squalens]
MDHPAERMIWGDGNDSGREPDGWNKCDRAQADRARPFLGPGAVTPEICGYPGATLTVDPSAHLNSSILRRTCTISIPLIPLLSTRLNLRNMGRSPWSTQEEFEWLLEQLPGFRVARANETSAQFLNATYQGYFDKFWPGILQSSAIEVGKDGGEVTGPGGVTFKKRKDQIYWWFWNRRFGKTGVKKAKEGISLTPKRPVRLQPYQAYLSLYKDTIMPAIQQRFNGYKVSVPPAELRTWWSFMIEQAKEMLTEETAEVQAAVEGYREQTAQIDYGLESFLDESETVSEIDLRNRARSIQGRLDALPKTLQGVLESLEQQTGWKGTIIVGGPHPETGKFAVMSLHHWRTRNLGNMFSEATPLWTTFKEAYMEFVVSCFPVDVCKKVHEAYRGLAALVAQEPSSTSQAVSADAVTSNGTPPTASQSLTTATEESSTQQSSQGKTATAEQESTPTYEELRQAQIRRNQELMESLGLADAAKAVNKPPGRKRGRKPKNAVIKDSTSVQPPPPETSPANPSTRSTSSTLALINSGL